MMTRLLSRRRAVLLATTILAAAASAEAQRRAGPPRHPPHPAPAVVVRGHVFIGGYFYDPAFGRYPWWPRPAYPYWYFPVYDNRAELRVQVKPKQAEVFVDDFYAGIVDDFDGVFQGLPLPPGGHGVVLYLEGYRTAQFNLYLHPGATFRLRHTMEKLPAGEVSEPRPYAPPVPPPPPGSFRLPRTPAPATAPAPARKAPQAAGFGTLDLYVQPAGAAVAIDGQQWASSEAGHYVVQVPQGTHKIVVSAPGHRPYSADHVFGEGETVPLNVSLMRGSAER
jgi:hypothetical protein